MDTVQFAVNDSSGTTEVIIRINETSLIDLARAAEQPWADREGKPNLAGSYMGLGPWALGGSSTHFLDNPRAVWFDDGDTVLLGCDCGEWGCWPLVADITATDVQVTWSCFRQGHRDWNLSTLGPFVFARPEYDEALRKLDEDLRAYLGG
ncbi:hypothetical protein SAMN04489844_1625 [Nocardioides exalbidus]|uniref:Uncharacterized protein n=1 Tax=Nocardioides exalbidus TaxID=402596 RepID=A0A1H4PIY7_9ACTN|nr:hypothetical protein [Nocardioides exalbidus]SEC07396.1 hypothetical protein SAMN04489844_1625 [Nocardioides exalbidus]